MINIFNIFIGSLWFLSALVDYSNFCYLWQLKEYRIDRMRDFMSTNQGRDFWRGYTMFWRSVIVILIFFWPINSVLTTKYFLIAIFCFELIRNVYHLYQKKLRHPSWTKKSVLIILLSISVEGLFFAVTRDWEILLLLLILRFFVISFISILLILPTTLAKKYYIKKATEKISKYKNLTVIGVTGSYGKTTVKTFLNHILSKNFKVISTPKNTNTEIGVADFILKNSFEDVDVFVVEMGAYKMGEIKMICDMVKPKVGILTAISEQHLSLFGGIKQTQKAKYELLRSLPKDGLAILNNDNKYCREYKNELACKVQSYGVDAELMPNCLIEKISGSKDGIVSSGKLNGESWEISAPILGRHNTFNIAPCIITGRYLGMSFEDIKEQCKTLALPEKTIKLRQYGQSFVIDDSYNSNYDGFCAALDILSSFPSEMERVVVTRGIPELGEKSDELHQKIGEEIAYLSDTLVIINEDFEASLRKGVGDKYKTKIYMIDDQEKLLSFVKGYKEKKAVILLENRVPSIVHQELTKN